MDDGGADLVDADRRPRRRENLLGLAGVVVVSVAVGAWYLSRGDEPAVPAERPLVCEIEIIQRTEVVAEETSWGYARRVELGDGRWRVSAPFGRLSESSPRVEPSFYECVIEEHGDEWRLVSFDMRPA